MTLQQTIEEIFNRWSWADNADELVSHVASGQYEDPFPVIAGYLFHDNRNFQGYAFEIMMRIDPERSMDYAGTLLHDESWHFAVCHLIARCGGTKQVQPQVIDILLRSPSTGTRVMAAHALGRIGDANAVPALQYAQEYDHDRDSGGWRVSIAATEAIEKIQGALHTR
jgi:hypothetical protein